MCCGRHKGKAESHKNHQNIALQRAQGASQADQMPRGGRIRLAPPRKPTRGRHGASTRLKSDRLLERLTWEGHDFADSIADDTLWKKAKEKVIKPSASWTFAILGEYLKFEIKHRLGIDVP